jgi:hypothetical protein
MAGVSLASGHDEAAKALSRRLVLTGNRMATFDAIAGGERW